MGCAVVSVAESAANAIADAASVVGIFRRFSRRTWSIISDLASAAWSWIKDAANAIKEN